MLTFLEQERFSVRWNGREFAGGLHGEKAGLVWGVDELILVAEMDSFD